MAHHDVIAATEKAIAAATHLTDADAGAVAVLRDLARTIEALGSRPSTTDDGKPLPMDNVSIPTYLKFCEQLGLTPAGRVRLGDQKPKPAGRLGQLREIRGGAANDDGDPKPKRPTRKRTA